MPIELVQIYQCLCDLNRLRILHLLTKGPLCVCHFQEVLELPQAKVSQHLAYLRKRGMVECSRRANWMIYSLPAERALELDRNLQCLQDCAAEDPRFRSDLARLAKAMKERAWVDAALSEAKSCC
jgi:ArsR family transcriptional regulator